MPKNYYSGFVDQSVNPLCELMRANTSIGKSRSVVILSICERLRRDKNSRKNKKHIKRWQKKRLETHCLRGLPRSKVLNALFWGGAVGMCAGACCKVLQYFFPENCVIDNKHSKNTRKTPLSLITKSGFLEEKSWCH